MRKFRNLNFPIFALKELVTFEYTFDKIFTTIEDQKFLVDDKSIEESSYFNRLLILDSNPIYQRIIFDYTIRTMEDLIKSDCKIGIDNSGIIRNFSIREPFKYAERNIVKTFKHYFWFKNISYPFSINLPNIDEIANNKEWHYGQLTYINYNWYFLNFCYDKTDKKYIFL